MNMKEEKENAEMVARYLLDGKQIEHVRVCRRGITKMNHTEYKMPKEYPFHYEGRYRDHWLEKK